ncbi:unnamed protein product [Bemisia tabaci]|uniref:Zinc finger CCHC-type and RNA-binding motif-containing protein 1 n=1 Tax=Bemisia tabaci TaxID=7038 RepID=A0A9P0A6Q2_BEMTA|nr:PREDICTED: zinc finger CCHC-type and RNA-binding motif-containing protein 1-like [Bemisia tabaci]CAH0385100.1 unnamed protein product [Bemisia tabaci]
MSNKLAPSRSTVYVSNLPFSLTNNDLHKLFEKYGKVVKVTIVKDRIKRRSKGVAFILFLNKEDAHHCVKETNMKDMFGRTIKSSIAKDNGRSAEFIRKQVYTDKSSCYECGEEGHVSYKCPKNALGEREPPPKKEKVRKKKEMSENMKQYLADSDDDDWREERKKPKPVNGETSEESEGEEPDLETLSAAIQMEREQAESNKTGGPSSTSEGEPQQFAKRKKFKKNSYFSDEEELSD